MTSSRYVTSRYVPSDMTASIIYGIAVVYWKNKIGRCLMSSGGSFGAVIRLGLEPKTPE